MRVADHLEEVYGISEAGLRRGDVVGSAGPENRQSRDDLILCVRKQTDGESIANTICLPETA
jgi:hypothetical protein